MILEKQVHWVGFLAFMSSFVENIADFVFDATVHSPQTHFDELAESGIGKMWWKLGKGFSEASL